jgi:hypothetical protein
MKPYIVNSKQVVMASVMTISTRLKPRGVRCGRAALSSG